jgi:hypothetical protein
VAVDYFAWHDAYAQPGSPLHLRLLVVQDLIAQALDTLPAGPVRVISMCAGQGRDVITATSRHRRGGDVTGRLVELDPRNVALAREAVGRAALPLEVVQGDAGRSDSYEGATPADLVLVCGVFGNIPLADMERTIRSLPQLCARGAFVLWTRHPREPGVIPTIEGWLQDVGCVREALVVSELAMFGVGAHRFLGDPEPLRPGVHLFDFIR